MIRKLLICGLLAGVVAGTVATGFAWIVGESPLNQAIALEDARAEAAGEIREADLVPRYVQSTLGLFAAIAVFGLSVGGLFALVFSLIYGRVEAASPAKTAIWLALAAFFVVFLVPFAKYSSGPPSVGDPETIGERTLLYVAMIALSIASAAGAVWIRGQLKSRTSPGAATVFAGAIYVLAMLAIGRGMPRIDEVSAEFPATTLWQFRQATVGIQAVLWATIGLVFAVTADRVMRGESMFPRRDSNRQPAAAAVLE
ncbi:MAG: CbtA family protein [Solirubrobacterales bacterium]|nr:CbtA family protein [Solirubrobacterales bacterium]